MKACLRKVLSNARLTFDELKTVLMEVETTINCRPLTYECDEPGEEVLTPSHLIYGRRIRGMPDEIVEPDDYKTKNTCDKRFRYLTQRLQHFWKRWRREYLVNLREFHRPQAEDHGVAKAEVGDVVTVFEEEVKRNKWKLVVIKELIKGKDGVVRGAKVRVLTNGIPFHVSRPVQKLYPLEIKSKHQQQAIERAPAHERDANAPAREVPKRSAALDAGWKTKVMLDS